MTETNKEEIKIELKMACVFLPRDIRTKIAEGQKLTKEEQDEHNVLGRWMGDQEVIDHRRANPETLCGEINK